MAYQIGSYGAGGEWHSVAGFDPAEVTYASLEDAKVGLDEIATDLANAAGGPAKETVLSELQIREIASSPERAISTTTKSKEPIQGNGWYELEDGSWGYYRWRNGVPEQVFTCDHKPTQEEHDDLEQEEREAAYHSPADDGLGEGNDLPYVDFLG